MHFFRLQAFEQLLHVLNGVEPPALSAPVLSTHPEKFVGMIVPSDPFLGRYFHPTLVRI